MPLQPETVRRVDAIVALAQARDRVPALVAAIVRDGEMVHFAGAGEFTSAVAELRPGPDTQFRIGSITKTTTAALIMGLRDEGRLAL
jgi:CubicO group peptidase (beta-lactamase class C family)